MPWTVEVTEEFETWWNERSDDERVSIDGMIRVLETHGPALGTPYTADVADSKHQLRQLLVPHQAQQICVLYVVEDARAALVLLTGTTAGTIEEACPPDHVALAETVYERYVTRRTDS